MTQQEQISRAAHDLETVLRRFNEEFQSTGNRHFGNNRRGHTELADAWAYALDAFESIIPLVKDHEVSNRLYTTAHYSSEKMSRMFQV